MSVSEHGLDVLDSQVLLKSHFIKVIESLFFAYVGSYKHLGSWKNFQALQSLDFGLGFE